MSPVTYRLIDFGDGRKLEALGDYLIDRPSPAAMDVRKQMPGRWSDAMARYDGQRKSWCFDEPFPAETVVDCGGFVMPVRATPFGHLGIFPEQKSNWGWLAGETGHMGMPPPSSKLNALNLFAYTGASSIALATTGFHVAHVDAAKPNVDAARAAAHVNGLVQAPIRYLVDDAAKFAAREVRREREYQTVVLDPPAYGHSPKGKAWRLERDLWPLLDDCLRLIRNHLVGKSESKHARLLITGHSPDVGVHELTKYLHRNTIVDPAIMHLDSNRSGLIDDSERRLDTGFQVRVTISGAI